MKYSLACLSAIVCLSGPLCAATVNSLRGCDGGHSKLAEASYNGNWYWADQDAFPNAETDYVVVHPLRSLASNGHSHTFGGHSLAVRHGYWVKAWGTETFNGGGLFLEQGGYLGNWGIAATYTIKGTAVTVTAPTGAKFGFYPSSDITVVNSAKARFVFDAPLVGAAGTGFYVSQHANPTIAEGYQWFYLVLKNDCSGYRGDIELRRGGILLYEGTAATFPATIVQQAGSTFSVNCAGVPNVSITSLTLNPEATCAVTNAANAVTVGTLVYNGGNIRLALDPATGDVAALNATAFTMNAAELTLDVATAGRAFAPEDGGKTYGPFLSVPASSSITTNDIRIADVPGYDVVRLPTFYVVSSEQGGVRSFSLVARPVVLADASDPTGTSCLAPNAGGTDGNTHWSDDLYPHADADYLNADYDIRCGTDAGNDVTFIGNSLTIGNMLRFKGRALFVKDLRFASRTHTPRIAQSGFATNVISGGTMTVNTSMTIEGSTFLSGWSPTWGVTHGGWPSIIRPKTLIIESEICGPGNIQCKSSAPSADEPFTSTSYFDFTGMNTNYTGQVKLTCGSTNWNDSSILSIHAPEGLGGRRKTFHSSALFIEKNAALWPRATMTLDDPTRGIWISGKGRFIISNDVEFTVKERVALAGELRKEGDGLLALGGQLTFVNDQLSTAPLAGTNVLTVAQGSVKPLATNALNGAAIAFKSGTTLRLDWPAADAAVGTYGLYDVKWTTPFDLTDNGGMLDVAFDVADGYEPPSKAFAMPICTVSSTAPSLEGCIRVARPFQGRGVSVLSKTVAAGTVTWYAEVQTKGTILIMR